MRRGTGATEILDDPTETELRAALRRSRAPRSSKSVRLIVASRPDGAAASLLTTQQLYGHVEILGDADLFLTPDECSHTLVSGLHDETAGWPLLVDARLSGRELAPLLPRYLLNEILPSLPLKLAAALIAALTEPLSEGVAAEFRAPDDELHPLLRLENRRISVAGTAVATALEVMLSHDRSLSAALKTAVVRFITASGNPAKSIVGLNSIGRTRDALSVFDRSGGPFFGFVHGFAALESALDSFGPDAELRHENLLLARLYALFKRGRAREALRRLDAHHPSLPVDLQKLQTSHPPYAVLLRIDIAINLDERIREDTVNSWGRLEAVLEPDDHLARGILYNLMTIAFLRLDELPRARQLAEEAFGAYQRADSPYLMHYMCIHLADIASRESRLRDVGEHLAQARLGLERSGVSSDSELATLELFTARLAYEEGRLGDCPSDIAPILGALVVGDSWPGLIWALLAYAPFAAFWQRGLRAAIETAEQCILALGRRHGPTDDRGLVLMRIRLFQIARRHSEAAARLAELDLVAATPTTRHLAAEEGLIRLRAEILQHTPVESDLRVARSIAELPQLDRRQRVSLHVLRAYLHYRLNDRPLAKRNLIVALRLASAEGLIGVLLEDSEILERLLALVAANSTADHSSTADFARQLMAMLRRLPASGVHSRANAGLSRQEHRVLAYLADGCSNKEIARALAVSESAIKFHLRNLFRKLGAARRGEALERARKRGLVS